MRNLYLRDWANRWAVPPEALNELFNYYGMLYQAPTPSSQGKSEAYLQQQVRLKAPHQGILTFRNNVGAAMREDGTPIRFGLGNDSKKINDKLKSSDLIGIKKVLITPEMVGMIIGQFWARECKKPGWEFTGNERETAQLSFHELATSYGADAAFITSLDQI